MKCISQKVTERCFCILSSVHITAALQLTDTRCWDTTHSPDGGKTPSWAGVKHCKSPSVPWLVLSQQSPSLTWSIPARNLLQWVTADNSHKTPSSGCASWEMKTFNIRRPWTYFLFPSLFFSHHKLWAVQMKPSLMCQEHEGVPSSPQGLQNILHTGATFTEAVPGGDTPKPLCTSGNSKMVPLFPLPLTSWGQHSAQGFHYLHQHQKCFLTKTIISFLNLYHPMNCPACFTCCFW